MGDNANSMITRKQRANAIRALAMDAVEQAQSGHPGAPMGLADMAEVLWCDILRYSPTNPDWWNRDRVVLSNGHASMLMYAVLHLTGYDLSISDIRGFRQLHSKTAGHPELGVCPGIETTTGPLGQGFANAVGMALAETILARQFNRPDFAIVDHRTWTIVGDGCLMEGISHEAASLAGTLKLGKLTAIYDDNGISIDGATSEWYTEDVPARFESYGWEVIPNVDGHDPEALGDVLSRASQPRSAPMLVCCKTTIGYGAPQKAGTSDAHGSPLGDAEIAEVRRRLDWPHSAFVIPADVKSSWDRKDQGKESEACWNQLFDGYAANYPELAEEFHRRMAGHLPMEWDRELLRFARDQQESGSAIETRKASGKCLDILGPTIPELIGGSADLTSSNNTKWKGATGIAEGGRYLSYGVREFGMTAISNGLALHGGVLPYTGTFLVFMEYARNAVRLASLMKVRNLFVYTHDSVALGEDGPTHQPIEQLTNLRTTPNLSVWRPCDSVETALAWKSALLRDCGPTAIVLTRQKLQVQNRDPVTIQHIERGAYVLRREQGQLKVIIIATGSEVEVAVEAADKLSCEGIQARVVSMPSVDCFLSQPESYREEVLPSDVRARVAVEAAHPDYWWRFVGLDGEVVGISRYGLSAPGTIAMLKLGIQSGAVVDAAERTIEAVSS